MGSCDCAKAKSSSFGTGGGAFSEGCEAVGSTGSGAIAGAAGAAATVFDLATFFGLAVGVVAAGVSFGAGAASTSVSVAGSAATGGSTPAPGKGSTAGTGDGIDTGTVAGRSTARSSGISIRRSCQGKPKPGSPRPWPLTVRLNRSAWIARESMTPSARCRCLSASAGGDSAGACAGGGFGASTESVKLKLAPPWLPGHGFWRGAGRRRGLANVSRGHS